MRVYIRIGDYLKIKLTASGNYIKHMIPQKIISDIGVEFVINDPSQRKCDAWFVLDDYGPVDDVVAVCPPENMFFSMGEAEQIKIYNRCFVQQFHNLITCQKMDYGVPNVIMDYFAVWFVGLKFDAHGIEEGYDFNYDELSSMAPVKKTKLISVISSNKTMCEGHRQRLAFVEKLKAHFGDKIDVFGRGIRDFTDKWDVLAPYKYHIAIENQRQDYYVTEKIMDPYLAFSYPIYYGAPNVARQFLQASFMPIDIKDANRSITRIEELIAKDIYEKKLPAIMEARRRVLNEENFFVKIAKLATQCSSYGVPQENIIRHEYEFSLRWRIKKFLHWGE